MLCEIRSLESNLGCNSRVAYVILGSHNPDALDGEGTGRIMWYKLCAGCGISCGNQNPDAILIPIGEWEDLTLCSTL